MGAKDPIPTAESLRRTTERLRSDRCMHWMDAENEDACVLAGEGNDLAGEYASGADQRHGCACAKRGKKNLPLDRGRTNDCTQ